MHIKFIDSYMEIKDDSWWWLTVFYFLWKQRPWCHEGLVTLFVLRTGQVHVGEALGVGWWLLHWVRVVDQGRHCGHGGVAWGEHQHYLVPHIMLCSASKSSIRRFVITEEAPTRAFSWLKAATTAFTFKTLLWHYAKRALAPQSLNVTLGPRHNYHKGRAAIRH